ncbi:MAG TPA: hypothetical protein VHA80_13630 [Solirubrobacterales bacterium]|nr:hypothetical protein [Solirubrobacterales bacterium]
MNDGPRGGGGPLLAWACLQLALGTMLALWGEQVPALLFLGGAIPLLLLSAWNRVFPPSGRPRLLARVSVPVVVLALATAIAALGTTAGLWLFLIGAELGLFALVWLLREILVERRTVR